MRRGNELAGKEASLCSRMSVAKGVQMSTLRSGRRGRLEFDSEHSTACAWYGLLFGPGTRAAQAGRTASRIHVHLHSTPPIMDSDARQKDAKNLSKARYSPMKKQASTQ